MAYISVGALKTYLGIKEETDDGLLEALIARAQGIIDRRCGRTFEAASDTIKYFDAERDVDGDTIYLDEDLAAITTVTNGDGTTLTAAQYATEPRNRTPYYAIKIRSSASVAWEYSSTTDDHENAIAITGKWAYSVTAPADIVQACVRLAGYLYRQKDNAAELDRPIVAGNATILPSRLPADLDLMLRPYVKVTK